MVQPGPGFELWGGVECTVNRIGDRYFDQVHRSGHHDRGDDLDRFAALGIRALRYPVLWERVAPDGLARADWSWTDARLARLRELGIRPVVGLLHHGSGPRETNLLDPGFPEAFARYAGAVARRYPWIDAYTPVNEPLTTARFSALYGHWYPHHCSDRSFVTAFLNQMKATVLAMAAIRSVNPAAQLVQTEDAGYVFSTPPLAYQAAFENHRRWLTFDALTGRVTRSHPLRGTLKCMGASSADLGWLADHRCPPDIIGLNYYLTSDRYLDHRRDRYPPSCQGGNAWDRYADVEAVRACAGGCVGHRAILEEAWWRYRLPLAITEVHSGGGREDQLRWLAEAWDGAAQARARGSDVRAVTVWALLGSFDWNSLLTRCDGCYESGAFDARSDPPRATAVAALARGLASGDAAPELASQAGWWRRPDRWLGAGRADASNRVARAGGRARLDTGRPLAITGSRGTLGSALVRACATRGLYAIGLARGDLDITDERAIAEMVRRLRPWGIVNAAGHVRVDAAERERDECLLCNAQAPGAMAAVCAREGVRFVTFSSDLVFDGGQDRPYVETDRPRPLNVYGMSKLEAEHRVRAAMPDALVVRTSAFFGPVDEHNFLTTTLRAVKDGRRVRAAEDAVVSPTYVPDLVHATLDLLIDGESGVWHLANCGQASWLEFAVDSARRAGLDASLIEGVPTRALGCVAPRPPFSALGSARGHLLPPLQDAVARYLHDVELLRATA